MNADIRPEPTDEERAALLAALQEQDEEASPYAGAWRLSALQAEDDDFRDGF